MCCFAGAVRNVSRTRIFGRLSDTGSQFLAYQMKYESDEPNAMILPLPVKTPAAEESIRFIDLSDYEHFFRDLASGFPYIRPRVLLPMSRRDTAANAAKLVVHEVGKFVASFVPTIDDFARLDPRFVIPKETWLKIPVYNDYGFAVFQLKEGAVQPHPMAFEFQTRLNDIFFPTVHIHDGEVHRREAFDHKLYMQHAGFDSVVGTYRNRNVVDSASQLVRSKWAASKFCNVEKTQGLVLPDLLVHRRDASGTLANVDLTYSADGDPLLPTFNYRRLYSRWPWLAAGVAISAPLAWIIARRNRLRRDGMGRKA